VQSPAMASQTLTVEDSYSIIRHPAILQGLSFSAVGDAKHMCMQCYLQTTKVVESSSAIEITRVQYH
jgi:hypothetical protein